MADSFNEAMADLDIRVGDTVHVVESERMSILRDDGTGTSEPVERPAIAGVEDKEFS